jgi:exopolyphosphatase/pppGpp-phosphohydrolase
MGMSVGKWNGDSLEVQTVGVREDVRYQGMPHSGKMKIVEKLRLTGPDQLQDEVVIHDPDTLIQPLRLTFHYKRELQHRILEYPCQR